MEMSRNNASLAEIKFHLKHYDDHHIDVGRTTIRSFIKKIEAQEVERDESLF